MPSVFACACAEGLGSGYARSFAKIDAKINPPLAEGKSSMGRLDYFEITRFLADTKLEFPTLRSDAARYPGAKFQLSLATALEMRKNIDLEIWLGDSSEKICLSRLYNAYGYQIYRFEIPRGKIDSVAKLGLRLAYKDCEPEGLEPGSKKISDRYCCFAFDPKQKGEMQALSTHILISSGNCDLAKNLFDNFCSLNSILSFGWMSGCQTEGLYELASAGDARAERALDKHLKYFMRDDKGICFENHYGYVFENGKFDSIEDFLPFAAIMARYPKHKSVKMFLDWALPEIKNNAGKPIDERFLSTEGCYTFAYPLLRVAEYFGDVQMARTAVKEICARIDRLVAPDCSIYQRACPRKTPTHKNWTRGAAWLMLGLVQSLRTLERMKLRGVGGAQKMFDTMSVCAERLLNFQKDGFWYCYFDDPKTLAESSSSMGLAAAYAMGVEAGYLDKSYLNSVDAALKRFFTPENIEPDGVSKNVTQSNRLGEDFQRRGYRVLMPLAAGLAVQAVASNRRMGRGDI